MVYTNMGYLSTRTANCITILHNNSYIWIELGENLIVHLILTNSSIRTDHKHCKIWTITGEAKDGGFQVLVVTRQINECDHFRGTLTNLLCCPRLAVIHNLKKENKQTNKISYQLLTFHADGVV